MVKSFMVTLSFCGSDFEILHGSRCACAWHLCKEGCRLDTRKDEVGFFCTRCHQTSQFHVLQPFKVDVHGLVRGIERTPNVPEVDATVEVPDKTFNTRPTSPVKGLPSVNVTAIVAPVVPDNTRLNEQNLFRICGIHFGEGRQYRRRRCQRVPTRKRA